MAGNDALGTAVRGVLGGGGGLLVQTAVAGVPLRLIACASAGFLPGALCKAALAATVAATFRR